MDPTRVLIADDHALMRDGLRAVLAKMPEVELAGEAATGLEAVEKAIALLPDVILMDIQMPGISGIEATRRILRAAPRTGVIIVSVFADDDLVFAMMRAGARGYVLKEADDEELMRAVRGVANGEASFSPAIAARLIDFFRNLNAPAARAADIFPELTAREREILALIAQGKSNNAIAQALFLSEKTIRNYASNVFDKLQVATRAEAIIRARDAGLR
jgi:DNA-binding NarL/FixJ family response regulator